MRAVPIAVFAFAAGLSPALAQQAAELAAPERLWQGEIAAPEGWVSGFSHSIAIRADGTLLIAAEFERKPAKPGDSVPKRHRFAAFAPDGKKLWEHGLPPAQERSVTQVSVVPGPQDGFTAVWSDLSAISVFRVGAAGAVPVGAPALRMSERAKGEQGDGYEITGIALGPQNRLAIYGGWGMGPHAPWIAVLDARSRRAWEYLGRHAMPPGGVRDARFVAGGALDSITVDRETPYLERRNAAGVLETRTRLARALCRQLGKSTLGLVVAEGEADEKVSAQIVDRAGKPRATVPIAMAPDEKSHECFVREVADDLFLFVAGGARAVYVDGTGRVRGGFVLGAAAWKEYRNNFAAGRFFAYADTRMGQGAVTVALYRLPAPAP